MKDPMSKVGIPLRYDNLAWYRRNYIKRAHKIADECAEFSGHQHHVVRFGSGVMIINSKWRKAYNKRVPRDGRITCMHVLKEAYYSTK